MSTFSQESARHWKQTIPYSSVFFRYNFFSKIESNLLASICSPINHTY